MGKKKFTRFISLGLAVLFLVSGSALAVGAEPETSSVTDKSIADYENARNLMSYEEYLSRYCSGLAPAGQDLTVDALDNLVFTSTKGDTVTIRNGQWTLTTKDGTVCEDENNLPEGYSLEDLVHITEYDGKAALYTPAVGATTWTIDLAGAGVSEKALYNIIISYYPIANKNASPEREFYLNGEVPFDEARALTLPKNWASYRSDAKEALLATYQPEKKISKDPAKLASALAEVKAEAEALGLTAALAEDGSALTIEQPVVITSAINSFIEKYELRFFVTDMSNNELRPTMVQVPKWMEYTIHDSDGYYSAPLMFAIGPDENGEASLTLDGVNEPVAISSFTLTAAESNPSYEEYLAALQAQGVDLSQEGGDVVRLEGEYTTNTSTNVVYPVEDRSDALTSPVDTHRTMLNTIGTEKWETAGQWIEYKFQVNSAGMYEIFTRFKQSYLDGMYVCRTLKIYTDDYESAAAYAAAHGGSTAGYYDGVPFEEATQLRFDYNNSWQVKGLSKGGNKDETYPLYFEKDVTYTLHFEVALGSMSALIREIESILNALNDDYLSIIKLTGSSPDDYRDYSFTRLLPNTMLDMLEQAERLKAVSDFLKNDTVGVASSYTGICDKLRSLLENMGRDEDAIAKNLDNFKSYVGSFGTFLTDAKTQPLQVDYFSIQGASVKAPKAKANFFYAFAHEISSFLMSFFRDYNSMGSMDTGDTQARTVDVWLAYGRDQSQVIRNLCTNDFTPDSQISVDLKLISGGTLLPSILAGMGPDVYLGLAQVDVINYAIRGALMNVEDLEDFDEVRQNFNDAAMTVLSIRDSDGDMHCYGLPENQQFPMMFIRTDILADLGIEIPTTWEDIYKAQSKLESNNMEIGVTTDYKMHLYQLGGELFADDGMRINLDSVLGLKAFETMCNMFTQYSFPYKYSAANRFRTGEMPIIISDYTALYNHLKVFATELDGCWTFVPLPGYKQEDGTINNCAVSTVTAAVMIKEKNKDYTDAWTFMKWYTDAPCQTQYANEMVAILGDSAKHSTANIKALESMPWTNAEYIEVSKQFNNLASIPNYPGYYILDRYTNFAFLSAYNNDADPSSELLSYIKTINKEITRKRQEFKLETLEIGQKLSDKRSSQTMEAISVLTSEYIKEGNERFAAVNAAIDATKYAIANSKTSQMREASQSFANILASYNITETMTLTKADGKTVEVPVYYVNVGKQTAESKDGGYKISSLNEQQLLYFISECLNDIADALDSY